MSLELSDGDRLRYRVRSGGALGKDGPKTAPGFAQLQMSKGQGQHSRGSFPGY